MLASMFNLNLSWPAPALDVDEVARLTVPANLVLLGVARGGNLVMTNRRLIFHPNSVEARLGVKALSWPRDSISSVGIARRGVNLFGGAVKRRLRVALVDGAVLRFVVPRVDEVANQLAAMVRSVES